MDVRAECWRIDAFELWYRKRLLIQPVHPKGNQSWIFIRRTDAEAGTPILWPPDANNWLIWKDPVAGKDRRCEEKGTTKDKMVGWHHRLNGHDFEKTLGVGDGQGGLACCSPWGHKETDTTEQLNWTELNYLPSYIFMPIINILFSTSFLINFSYWSIVDHYFSLFHLFLYPLVFKSCEWNYLISIH